MKSLNTLFDVNHIIDTSETNQQRFVTYLPESIRTHAVNFTKAQYEFTRAAMATGERMSKIIRAASEDAAKKFAGRFGS